MDSDQRIAQHVKAGLTRDHRIKPAGADLKVQSSNGSVILSGVLPSVAAKRLASRLAADMEGVGEVVDRLRVETRKRMGDLELAEHVRNAFIQERNIEEGRIEIETDPEGGIILRGEVHSRIQVRLCEVLCWWIPGTSSVDNRLRIVPHEDDSDEELRDNLEVILEKDVLVDPKKFQILVKEGRVTLRGRVDSATERDAAEKDCWYTPGVLEVANELSLG